MLQPHHVRVAITRKTHLQAVARLTRLAVSEVVGQDDEIPARVEQLPFSEKATAERLAHELPSGPAGAMQNQDAVPDDSVGILSRLAYGSVMKLQLRE